MERITATEASRNFSQVLDRARHGGESFLVERNGEAVAEIRPPLRKGSLAAFIDFLENTPLPDPDFKRDIEEIVAERKRDFPRDRWADD